MGIKAGMVSKPEQVCESAEAGGRPELDLALAGRAGGRVGRGAWAAGSDRGRGRLGVGLQEDGSAGQSVVVVDQVAQVAVPLVPRVAHLRAWLG